MYIPAEEVKVAEVDVEEGEKNIERFESLCRKNGIEYRVHKDFTDFAMPGLKKENTVRGFINYWKRSFL